MKKLVCMTLLSLCSVTSFAGNKICLDKAKSIAQNDYSIAAEKIKYIGHDVDQAATKYGVDAKREFYLLDAKANLVLSLIRITSTGECKQSSLTFGPQAALPQGFIAE